MVKSDTESEETLFLRHSNLYFIVPIMLPLSSILLNGFIILGIVDPSIQPVTSNYGQYDLNFMVYCFYLEYYDIVNDRILYVSKNYSLRPSDF